MLSAPDPDRSQTFADLRALRSQISAYLHAEAPEWELLTPAISRLHTAMQTTQSATTLRQSLASLSNRHDYPQRMSAVVAQADKLSATVSVCAAATSFATLLQTIEQHPPTTTPHNFLQHAIALQKARTAAHQLPLSSVRALDQPRNRLDHRHAHLLATLQRHLLAAVYAGTIPFHPSTPNISPKTSTLQTTSPSPSPPSLSPHPSPTHTQTPTQAPPSVTPDLAVAVDLLAGPASSARLLVEAASPRIVSLIRDAVLSESSVPPRSVSLASSSFTAAAATSPTSLGEGSVFREPHSSRVACTTVFERVKYLMTAVLRRLSALADTVADSVPDMPDAVRAVWQTMEQVLMAFLQALLGFPKANFLDTEKVTGISLLPTLVRPSETDSLCKWELERGQQSSLDSFATLVSGVPNLSPSIYNLEVVYSPLQLFIMNSSRLQESWKDKKAGSHTLSHLLDQAVDLFLSTVRHDVKKYMDDAFGNRAGTMLQPFSARRAGASPSNNQLPALPQTKVLIDVIGSCLSLAAAVPTVASRLGQLINDDIIMPFSNRAVYALKLAASWTHAGNVLNEVTNLARDMIVESGKPTKNGLKRKGAKNGINALRSKDIFKKIRYHPDLTVKCIARLCETQKPWDVIPRLLVESEWNAVVRLVATTKFVIAELESCIWRNQGSSSNSASADTSALTETPEARKSSTLRALLNERGISPRLHGSIVEAIQKTSKGCKVLRDEVIARGIALLQSEVTLQCFSEVVKTLGADMHTLGDYENSNGSLASADDTHGNEKQKANGLSRPSSIFKVSQIQVSDLDNEEDDYAHGMNEYDEFGDRIATANEMGAEADVEEYGFPNSLLLEPNEWKTRADEASREKMDGSFAKKSQQVVTKADKRVVERGKLCGEQLKQRDICIQSNLTSKERDFILSQADAGVGFGIRYCGNSRKRGDREVATGARLFMDSVATVAAETMGWPVAESDYSVAEGASHSASECRTLLYSAGLL